MTLAEMQPMTIVAMDSASLMRTREWSRNLAAALGTHGAQRRRTVSSRAGWYKLVDRVPVRVQDYKSLKIEPVVVAFDKTPGGNVSTVFLHLDHGFRVEGPPTLFETMVFKKESSDLMGRYETW